MFYMIRGSVLLPLFCLGVRFLTFVRNDKVGVRNDKGALGEFLSGRNDWGVCDVYDGACGAVVEYGGEW